MGASGEYVWKLYATDCFGGVEAIVFTKEVD